MNNLDKLKSMSLDDRIKAIENDLISKNDFYKDIEPELLAQLLEVPLDAINGESPDDWYKWATWIYVEILSVEQLLDNGYQIDELINNLEDEKRIEFLLKQINDLKKIIIELTVDEKAKISLAIADTKLNDIDCDKYLQIAQYCLHTESNTSICFEATLNGVYSTMDSLKTPYDERDGFFLNVESNKKMYLSKFLNDI
jgi:hypothetical protein